ncbi:hypothetical protein Rsub_02452 [Raphidocelis subcapitata]|uniref:Uncharacterized protein n=1 Tax=Raphidocelis subcapitata TaxID=307507 RepID=A0A2V0NRT4_9CHLO|nr:hypothetical protein Rsub_02452 [Raphidocelis subcapitata]|eukprot:GBF90346.1 hypothetical protein Rsub_02452 [Raphidocelis subcapitata]
MLRRTIGRLPSAASSTGAHSSSSGSSGANGDRDRDCAGGGGAGSADRGAGSGGDGDGSRSGSGGDCATGARPSPPPQPPVPYLSPWTLRLSPPAAEREFWGSYMARFAHTDKYAWLLGSANLWTAFRSPISVEGAFAAGAMHVWLVSLLAATLAGGACMLLRPQTYYRRRHAFALFQRVARSGWMLVCFHATSSQSWEAFIERRAAVEPAVFAVAEALVLLAVFWVVHPLLFPCAFVWAAPMQLLFCCGGVFAMGSYACAVYARPAFAAAARSACGAAQAAKQLGLVAIGAAGSAVPGRRGLCEERPLEVLVPLASTAACLLSLQMLYIRERHLKMQHLSQLRLGQAPQPGPGSLPPGLAMPAAAACAVLASFTVAEAAAAWGRPYECGA